MAPHRKPTQKELENRWRIDIIARRTDVLHRLQHEVIRRQEYMHFLGQKLERLETTIIDKLRESGRRGLITIEFNEPEEVDPDEGYLDSDSVTSEEDNNADDENVVGNEDEDDGSQRHGAFLWQLGARRNSPNEPEGRIWRTDNKLRSQIRMDDISISEYRERIKRAKLQLAYLEANPPGVHRGFSY